MSNKWYAVMIDHEDDDWGTGSYDLEEAERQVANILDECPDGYIAVIDNGVCIEEIRPDDFSPIYYYAARVVKSHDYAEAQDDIAALARWLDMSDEWENADGEQFEDVLRKIGKMIGVVLI